MKPRFRLAAPFFSILLSAAMASAAASAPASKPVGPGPDWPFSLNVPKGWKSGNDCTKGYCRVMRDGRYIEWRTSYHHNSGCFDAAEEGLGPSARWAEFFVVYESFQYLNDKNFQFGIQQCRTSKMTSFGSYAMELNCERRGSCPPVEAPCGKFLNEMDLPLGTGYLFEVPAERHRGGKEFRDSVRELVILYDIPGAGGVHRIHFIAPRKHFDRYLPLFQKTAESYRVKAKPPKQPRPTGGR